MSIGSLIRNAFKGSSMLTASHEVAHGVIVSYYGQTVHRVTIGATGSGGYCEFDNPDSTKHRVTIFVAGYVQECIMQERDPGIRVKGGPMEGDMQCIYDIVGRGSEVEVNAIRRAKEILTAPGVQEYIREQSVKLIEAGTLTSIKHPNR